MLVRSLLVWSRLRSKHEMHAAELSDEMETDERATAVSVREFRCDSHGQIFTGTYFFAFNIVAFTSSILIDDKQFLATTTHVILIMTHCWMEDARTT